jgi:hypothetical protein
MNETIIKEVHLPRTEYRKPVHLVLYRIGEPYEHREWKVTTGRIVEWFETKAEALEYIEKFTYLHNTWRIKLTANEEN